jgi:hypothetical protein
MARNLAHQQRRRASSPHRSRPRNLGTAAGCVARKRTTAINAAQARRDSTLNTKDRGRLRRHSRQDAQQGPLQSSARTTLADAVTLAVLDDDDVSLELCVAVREAEAVTDEVCSRTERARAAGRRGGCSPPHQPWTWC